MSEPRWLTPEEERAWRRLQLMNLQLESVLARHIAANSDLSYPDFCVLVVLGEQPDHRLRMYELARALGWDKSRLSHHVRRMEQRSLITKEPCEGDRRGSFIVMSSEGSQQIDRVSPSHVGLVRECFVDLLTPAELEMMAEIADRVLTRIAQVVDPSV